MGRKLLITILSSLLMVSALSANAGPIPLPKDRKVADPPLRFEGVEQHADYIFHLYYYGYFVEATLIEVKDAAAFKLDFKRKNFTPEVSLMALLAMERKEFDKRKKEDPSLKWLTDKTEGVLVVKLKPPATTVPVNVKEIPVTTYCVTLKDGKLNAEKVEDKKPTSWLPIWAFGLVSSLSITWLGLWMTRRKGVRA